MENKKNPELVFYTIEYIKLKKIFFERSPQLYEAQIIIYILHELEHKKVYPFRINKPTTTGTKVKYKPLNDSNLKEAENKINDLLEKYFTKYGKDTKELGIRKIEIT